METVYLTPDILLHYPFSSWAGIGRDDPEKAQKAHEMFRHISNGKLVAYVSDVAVIETVKRVEEHPPEPKTDPETGSITVTPGFAKKKARIHPLIDFLIRYDTVLEPVW